MKKTVLYTAIALAPINEELDSMIIKGIEAQTKDELIVTSTSALDILKQSYKLCKGMVLRITRTITIELDDMEFTNEIYQLDYIGDLSAHELLLLEDKILEI